MGNGTDPGHWSTGNAWAAAGMLRVLGTIKNSQYANTMKNEQTDLTNWVKEIHNAMYMHIVSNCLCPIFVHDLKRRLYFSDPTTCSLTMPMTTRHSRMHLQLPYSRLQYTACRSSPTHIRTFPKQRTREKPCFHRHLSSAAAAGTNPNSLAGMTHFTSDGWLTPVVDPLSVGQSGQNSPEGQAFVVQMHAAWKDWVAQGSKGANAAGKTAGKLTQRIGASVVERVCRVAL